MNQIKKETAIYRNTKLALISVLCVFEKFERYCDITIISVAAMQEPNEINKRFVVISM